MAQFAAVAELAERMAGTASKLTKRAEIAAAIEAVRGEPRADGEPTSIEKPIEMGHPEGLRDVGLFCLYVAGLPFAEADPRKLNAGGALLTKALLAVSGASEVALREAYRRHGDLGAAGFDLLAASPTHRDAMNGARSIGRHGSWTRSSGRAGMGVRWKGAEVFHRRPVPQ